MSGAGRKVRVVVWDQATVERIKEIHQFLQQDPHQFFSGATAVAQEWRRRHPASEPPALRTIGRILAELGLSGRHRTGKAKGAARYLCYPEHTIYQQLPGRVLEADFIGKNTWVVASRLTSSASVSNNSQNYAIFSMCQRKPPRW